MAPIQFEIDWLLRFGLISGFSMFVDFEILEKFQIFIIQRKKPVYLRIKRVFEYVKWEEIVIFDHFKHCYANFWLSFLL